MCLQYPSPASMKPKIDRSSTFRKKLKLDETKNSISAKTDTFTSSFTTDLSTTRDQISATNSKLIRLDEQIEAIDEKVQTGLLTRNVSHKITFIKSLRCLLKILRIITRTPFVIGSTTNVYHFITIISIIFDSFTKSRLRRTDNTHLDLLNDIK